MIRVVTDSTSDLPPDLVQRYGIIVIPVTLIVDGQAYRDGVDISREEFYARLPHLKTMPTTAAPGGLDMEAAYRDCGDADIVSIHIASGFSGTLNVARLAAEATRQRVTIIDSRQCSMGLGWQAVAAAEAVAAGGTLAQVVAAVASIQKRIQLWALLDTLEYLRRGGRASALTAALGGLLQIKPLIHIADGAVTSLAKVRTHSRGIDELVSIIEQLAPLERLAVVHSNALGEARRVAERLARLLPAASAAVIADCTAVVGTQAGPGAVGVASVSAA
jgi:DegV family protein with EDD domain